MELPSLCFSSQYPYFQSPEAISNHAKAAPLLNSRARLLQQSCRSKVIASPLLAKTAFHSGATAEPIAFRKGRTNVKMSPQYQFKEGKVKVY